MKTSGLYQKINYHLLLILIIISSLTSCDKGLSRSEAEKQIKKRNELPRDEFRKIDLQQFKSVVTIYTFKSTGEKRESEKDNYPKSELFSYLEDQGLISVTIGKTDLYDAGYRNDYTSMEYQNFYIASFTNKAKPYVQGNSVKVCTILFGEITGIDERKEFNAAKVSYTTKRTNLTPFASVFGINEKVFNEYDTFTKYDDGWRID